MIVTISNDELDEVKSALGYPIIDQFEWGTGVNDFIKKYILPRVIRTYCKYFPSIIETSTPIMGPFQIDYPNASVYGLVNHTFNFKNMVYEGMSPFWLQTMIMSNQPNGFGMESQQMQENFFKMTTAESLTDFVRALEINDYPEERKVKGCVNVSGELVLTWGSSFEDFSRINYIYKDDAIKLAKGYLLIEAARIRGQVAVPNQKVGLSPDSLRADGDRYVEEVISVWSTKPRPVVLKS